MFLIFFCVDEFFAFFSSFIYLVFLLQSSQSSCECLKLEKDWQLNWNMFTKDFYLVEKKNWKIFKFISFAAWIRFGSLDFFLLLLENLLFQTRLHLSVVVGAADICYFLCTFFYLLLSGLVFRKTVNSLSGYKITANHCCSNNRVLASSCLSFVRVRKHVFKLQINFLCAKRRKKK